MTAHMIFSLEVEDIEAINHRLISAALSEVHHLSLISVLSLITG